MRYTRQATFGSYDGCTSILGMVAGVLHHERAIVFLAMCVAVTAAISMASGECLSDSGSGWREGLVMGAATFVGTMLPFAPLAFLPCVPGLIVGICLVLCLGGVIGYTQHRGWKGYAHTYGLLAFTGAVTFALSFAYSS